MFIRNVAKHMRPQLECSTLTTVDRMDMSNDSEAVGHNGELVYDGN